MLDLTNFIESETFTWVVLPILIFIARILDVTLGTIRIMFVARGNKLLAPLLGFFEVFIWLLAIGQIIQNLSNIFCYVAYAGGFAMGNYIGILIEEKLAVGKLVVRVITKKDAHDLVASLRRKGFGVTSVDAEGKYGKVNVVFTVVNRADMERLVATIQKINPKAFYTIEDTRFVQAGIFRRKQSIVEKRIRKPLRLIVNRRLSRRFRTIRKGK
jgi:uncharacterized protein YebE (UPF0316 family)